MEVIDLEDENDPNFLSLVEAAEADALAAASATKNKRQKISDQESVEVEGSYFAALRGSRSSLWQQQQEEKAKQRASSFTAGRGGGGGGGACYKCGASGHWARDCTAAGGGGGGSGRGGPAVDADLEEKPCPCGLGSCLVLTSTTAKNPGRKFYRCPAREENGGCNFFEWCDSPSSGLPSSGRASTEGRGSRGASKWSNEPNSIPRQRSFSSQAQGSYSSYSSSKSSGERANSSCFKCGQEGHWARDCTKSSSGSYSDAGGYNAASSGSCSCFKCGQAGHWARDCTAQDSGAGFGDRKASRSLLTPFASKYN